MAADEDFDVVVVGGGILGSALAYRLAHPGELRVALCDGNRPESATARSAGILTTVGWDGWDLDLVRRSSQELADISEKWGSGNYRRGGGLRVARSPEGAAWLERVEGLLRRAQVPATAPPAGALRDLAPELDLSDAERVLYTPDDATFSPIEVASAYRNRAKSDGAAVHVGGEPATIRPEGTRWAVNASEVTLRADQVVVACGAWTKSVVASVGTALRVAPFRTQAVSLRARPLAAPGPTLHDLDHELYLRTDEQGRLMVGDGTERAEADPGAWNREADPAFVERMISALEGVRPGSGPPSVETAWAGLCVASPDRFPVVGRIPGTRGLCVATGFNGLGAMRAPELARLLADGVASDRWDDLRLADPARFLAADVAFEVRPEFPLESSEADVWNLETAPEPSAVPTLAEGAPVSYRRLRGVEDLDGLRLPSLSEWFDPFLRLFLTDALRTGGEAEIAEADGRPYGAYLLSPAEGVASVFTRRRDVAEHFLDRLPPGGLYADRPWRAGGERILILAADLRDWTARRPLRHPVRLATGADLPRVRAFMGEHVGGADAAWFASLPRPEELCFLAEIDGRVAGVSWSTVVGAYARGHSFVVHPRYRGIGIGTDLLQARMLWLRSIGVRQVVSEIYEGNLGSQTAADRGGMAVVGEMRHYRPAAAT